MELPHIGRFVFHGTWLKVVGVGHRMEDIDKMNSFDKVNVLCADGQWYEIDRIDLHLFKDLATPEEQKAFDYRRFIAMDD